MTKERILGEEFRQTNAYGPTPVDLRWGRPKCVRVVNRSASVAMIVATCVRDSGRFVMRRSVWLLRVPSCCAA